jgi:hypothetical protein
MRERYGAVQFCRDRRVVRRGLVETPRAEWTGITIVAITNRDAARAICTEAASSVSGP